jgi:hypothetical protein
MEAALVKQLDANRYPAMQVLRHKRNVCAVWTLRSLQSVEMFVIARRPPPFAMEPRTNANRLRVNARGGMRTFLPWVRGGAILRKTHVDPDDALSAWACPWCGDDFTMLHLVAMCDAPMLEKLRRDTWEAAQALVVKQGSNGDAATCDVLDLSVRDLWARVTLGENVPREFVMGSAWEPEEYEEERQIQALNDGAGWVQDVVLLDGGSDGDECDSDAGEDLEESDGLCGAHQSDRATARLGVDVGSSGTARTERAGVTAVRKRSKFASVATAVCGHWVPASSPPSGDPREAVSSPGTGCRPPSRRVERCAWCRCHCVDVQLGW